MAQEGPGRLESGILEGSVLLLPTHSVLFESSTCAQITIFQNGILNKSQFLRNHRILEGVGLGEVAWDPLSEAEGTL